MQDLLDIRATLGLVDRAEQHVHVFQTTALGLLKEEKHKHAHGHAEDAKHQEGSPADVVDGTRGDLRDDKVEEPLRSRANTNAVGTEARGENLSHRQ